MELFHEALFILHYFRNTSKFEVTVQELLARGKYLKEPNNYSLVDGIHSNELAGERQQCFTSWEQSSYARQVLMLDLFNSHEDIKLLLILFGRNILSTQHPGDLSGNKIQGMTSSAKFQNKIKSQLLCRSSVCSQYGVASPAPLSSLNLSRNLLL